MRDRMKTDEWTNETSKKEPQAELKWAKRDTKCTNLNKTTIKTKTAKLCETSEK